ncbi:MAG TPA: hypothetical protein VHB73_06100, partial [Alphaproteobacteria bacterium]|nr:hypothetical protein [Alphaproteobacteria bacterium]
HNAAMAKMVGLGAFLAGLGPWICVNHPAECNFYERQFAGDQLLPDAASKPSIYLRAQAKISARLEEARIAAAAPAPPQETPAAAPARRYRIIRRPFRPAPEPRLTPVNGNNRLAAAP